MFIDNMYLSRGQKLSLVYHFYCTAKRYGLPELLDPYSDMITDIIVFERKDKVFITVYHRTDFENTADFEAVCYTSEDFKKIKDCKPQDHLDMKLLEYKNKILKTFIDEMSLMQRYLSLKHKNCYDKTSELWESDKAIIGELFENYGFIIPEFQHNKLFQKLNNKDIVRNILYRIASPLFYDRYSEAHYIASEDVLHFKFNKKFLECMKGISNSVLDLNEPKSYDKYEIDFDKKYYIEEK